MCMRAILTSHAREMQMILEKIEYFPIICALFVHIFQIYYLLKTKFTIPEIFIQLFFKYRKCMKKRENA